MCPSSNSPAGEGNASFCTTHWSAVLAARDCHASRAQEALAELCQAYWYPLYAYIRRRGHSPDQAEDLTQAFFERFVEKNYVGDITPGLGRFRSFLLTSLKHFLANEWDRAQTQKRGGGRMIISLDEEQAEQRYRVELADPVTPELLFEKQWALNVLERVLSRLRQEFVASEKREWFDELKVYLSIDNRADSYADVAARLGLKEGTVKVAVHRLRRRYGDLLRSEIANTVADPADVQEELRHLIQVLGTHSHGL